jgi:hypothetical protein
MKHDGFTLINIDDNDDNNNNNNLCLGQETAHQEAVENICITVVLFIFATYLTTL